MKKLLSLFLLLLATLPSNAQHPSEKIEITNISAFKRTDEPIVIYRKQLRENNGLYPLVRNNKMEIIPSQTDDVDGDGNWDELAFVSNLAPRQILQFTIEWVAKEKLPAFKPRTNIHFGKKTANAPVVSLTRETLYKHKLPRGAGYPYQTDGPSWENELVAYRHYFDGRNCRDVYGKQSPEMVMDTVGIRPDGTIGDTYHVLRSWGRDIYSVSQGLGIGGIAMLYKDTLIRLGVTANQATDNVDSTVFTLVNRGPVRAIFRLDHYGWQVKDKKYNVHQVVALWAGKHGYANKIWLEGDTTSAYLITGIVHNNDKNGLTVKNYPPGLTGLLTHDQQTYNREYYLGLALLLPSYAYQGYFDTPSQGNGILFTYCAKLKLPVQKPLTYYVFSGWELQDKGFRDSNYFTKMVTHESAIINMPAKIIVLK